MSGKGIINPPLQTRGTIGFSEDDEETLKVNSGLINPSKNAPTSSLDQTQNDLRIEDNGTLETQDDVDEEVLKTKRVSVINQGAVYNHKMIEKEAVKAALFDEKNRIPS